MRGARSVIHFTIIFTLEQPHQTLGALFQAFLDMVSGLDASLLGPLSNHALRLSEFAHIVIRDQPLYRCVLVEHLSEVRDRCRLAIYSIRKSQKLKV